MAMELTELAKNLSIPDRIRLVEEIWDTIAEENEAFELTDAQKRELDRRVEWVRNNPGQGRTWDEIKAEFLKSRTIKCSFASRRKRTPTHRGPPMVLSPPQGFRSRIHEVY